MPIEIKVTKELGNFEPKFIGPFTTRQAIIFGVCGASAVLMYKAAGNFLPKSMQWYACIPPGAVALLFNTPFYGMRFEHFLKAIFVNVFLAPTNRRYRTENTMEARIKRFSKRYDEAAEKAAKAEAGESTSKAKKLFGLSRKNSGSPDPKKTTHKPTQADKKKSPVGKRSGPKSGASNSAKNKNYKMSSKAIR